MNLSSLNHAQVNGANRIHGRGLNSETLTLQGQRPQSGPVGLKLLERRLQPTKQELAALASLDFTEAEVAKGEVLSWEADTGRQCFLITEGWALSYRLLLDGQRQVIDVYPAGEVTGASEMTFSNEQTVLEMARDGRVCKLRREQLHALWDQQPSLARKFAVLSGQEAARRSERIVNLGGKPSLARLAHFYAECSVRVATGQSDFRNEFDLPLTQRQIGEALGMTAVHVSRCVGQLRQLNVIETNNGSGISIVDRDKLVQLGEFDARYLRHEAA